MTKRQIVVVGAGGFAREVEWLISEINAVEPAYHFAGFVVSDLGKLVCASRGQGHFGAVLGQGHCTSQPDAGR